MLQKFEKGIACMKHDLVHVVTCYACAQELERKLKAAINLLSQCHEECICDLGLDERVKKLLGIEEGEL